MMHAVNQLTPRPVNIKTTLSPNTHAVLFLAWKAEGGKHKEHFSTYIARILDGAAHTTLCRTRPK